MKNVQEISLAPKEWQIKDTKQLNEINSALTFINENFFEPEKEIKFNIEEIKSLRKENSQLMKRLEEMDVVLEKYQKDKNKILGVTTFWFMKLIKQKVRTPIIYQ